MTPDALRAACLAQAGAYEDFPFGPEPLCVKVEGRIFAELYPSRCWITLKCSRTLAEHYRRTYPCDVVRGYHCPSSMWPTRNTVTYNQAVPDEEVLFMVAHSYEEVVRGLPKRVQKEIEKERQEHS